MHWHKISAEGGRVLIHYEFFRNPGEIKGVRPYFFQLNTIHETQNTIFLPYSCIFLHFFALFRIFIRPAGNFSAMTIFLLTINSFSDIIKKRRCAVLMIAQFIMNGAGIFSLPPSAASPVLFYPYPN